MPRYSANLGFLFADRPHVERVRAAAQAGFRAVEMHWPYDVPAEEIRSVLRESGVAVCSRGVTPRGPAWGGRFDVPIQCGGATIAPGDLVVGDEDGVIAVPLAEANDALLSRCHARLTREANESPG